MRLPPVLLPTLCFLLSFVCGTPSWASTEPYWNWRNPLPQGNDYYAVAFGNGRFVAVGPAGTITTSTDGRTWTAANSGVNHYLSSIAYGNGHFVVVGFNNGSLGLIVSDDGVSWRIPAGSLPSGWNKVSRVTFANGLFYGMSNNLSFVATSTDGVNWTQSASASAANVGRIGFAGGTYIGQDMSTGSLSISSGSTWTVNEARMLRSADGVTWVAGGLSGLAAISAGPVYFNGSWVVGGTLVTNTGGSQQFYRALSTSADGGATWTVAWHDPVSGSMGNAVLDGLAVFGGRVYVLGDPSVPIVSTADFTSVRTELPSQFIQLNAVAATADRVVAVGRYGRIATGDGSTWTLFGSSTVSGNLRGGAFGAGQWILAGDAGLAASADGVTWRMLAGSSSYTGGSIAYGNGRFVAGATDGHVGVSTDSGATWTDSSTRAVHGPLAFGHGRFVGAAGLVTSTDGMTWSAPVPAPGGTGRWLNVVLVDDVFYAVGTRDPDQTKDGVIARSVDGLTWTVVATMPERLASLGGKQGLLVACGFFGEVWTSSDGLSWTQASGKPLQSYGPATSILWVGASLVTVTFGGQVVTSDDGVTWVKDEFASSGTMFGLTAGNGQVLAYGAGGAIWEVGAARFARQPESRTVAPGGQVTFSVGVTGKEPLTYQWLKDGLPITGARSNALPGSDGGAAVALGRSAVWSPRVTASVIDGVQSRTLTISAAGAGDQGRYSVVVSNSLGATESGSALLVVAASTTPPSITSQPDSKTVNSGAAVTFSVVASGTAPLSYQWRKDNVAISGATNSSYTVAAASASDVGSYSVVVSNSAGSVISSAASLVVNSAPAVASQPESKSVNIGSPATLSVSATGAGTLTYQWRKDNVAIVGATGSSYTVSAVSPSDGGVYTVVVSNASGSTASTGATLTVVRSRFVNIATRAQSTSGAGVTIAGFVITGSSSKQVLIRGVGPSLEAWGLAASEVLADPVIELYRGSDALATNDNWTDNANAAAITTMAAQIGAAPLDASDTKSAAMLTTLEPGAYTFTAKGKNDAAGIALLEVYEVDSGASTFTNIATRVRCTTNNGVAVGGFVISGSAPKQVLMRAMGPTLANFGLSQTEVLLDPTIELHQGSQTLGTNDDWSDNANASTIVSVGARIGATAFATGDTKSSALLMTLQPGAYSFVVRGKNETSGIVLVEVYDAD